MAPIGCSAFFKAINRADYPGVRSNDCHPQVAWLVQAFKDKGLTPRNTTSPFRYFKWLFLENSAPKFVINISHFSHFMYSRQNNVIYIDNFKRMDLDLCSGQKNMPEKKNF